MTVEKIENNGFRSEVITPDDGYSYFFGYYDLMPFSNDGKYHLCHRTKFEDRIPDENDVCEIGVIDIQTKKFIKYAETTAWNFQQGALLQWYKDNDHIIFNIRHDGTFMAEILNVKTGEYRLLPMAVSSLSADCKYALCLNFSRIFDFRSGYGYAGIPDKFKDEKAPKNDGIYLTDTETCETKLILSYDSIKKHFPQKPYCDCKLLVNHITFNPSGKRWVALIRNFFEEGCRWKTLLITGDTDGKNLKMLTEYTVNSHYYWKNDDELLIVSTHSEKNDELKLYVFNDKTGEFYVQEGLPKNSDIHCIYSPDKTYIIGDGYPDSRNYRTIYKIDVNTGTRSELGSYYSHKTSVSETDYRCDLHNRFNISGKFISFDSNHIGKRCIAVGKVK